ncbi:hypothetical protein RJ639_045742 [Escallonia herrerae]|uniref:Formamidopyrimidine-DNA glycosylase catalytic domain-containing protein n=1 Tax=Escallonia herrerae TaxID=1293975 RepID=A0AA89B0D9_9ASTE|nr:hypothetical protein RJ639_045742 [Escallonia herrerae]
MPELPEVEAARRAIEDHCTGKKIRRSVIADDPKVIDGVSPSDFQAALLGRTIVAAHRKGKNMWLQLDSPPFPSFQFGMAGAIYIKGVPVTKYKRSVVNDTDEWPSKYSKLFIELDDGLELSFTDKRRFAKVRLLPNPASVPPISELGPDALLEPMTIDEFVNSLSKKKIGIKALLLDQTETFDGSNYCSSFQSYISGIGNWIADEVLYQAKIHPLQTAATMSKDSCVALSTCIEEVGDCMSLTALFHLVIGKAVEVGADSSQFPSNWIFHSREKKPGKAVIDGKKIEFITAGGRTTAYVPEVQKLSGSQATKAPIKLGKQTTKKTEDGNSFDDEKDADEPVSEEEKNTKSVKLTQRGGKKHPVDMKSNRRGKRNVGAEGADDNDGDQEEQTKVTNNPPARGKSKQSKKDDEDQRKGSRGGKKAPAKRKSKGSSDDDSSGEDYDGDGGDQKKVMQRRPKNVEQKVKEKVEISRSGRPQKKRAK